MTHEELREAAAHARDRLFADSLTMILGLAAETHPLELRTALAQVFDLSAIEETTRRLMLVVSAAQEAAQEARCLLEQIHRDIDELEKRIDSLSFRLERCEAGGKR